MRTNHRAAVYTRISQAHHDGDGTVSDLGVRRQQTECRQLCERRGWDVAVVFTDNDISAYSGKNRPGYQALLDALKDGAVDAVVAWHPDRLHRSPKELEGFIDLIDATRAEVATVTAGDYDLTTPSGRMTARIVGAVARNESEHKSERIRSKMKELAMSGKPHGGVTRPYGFNDDRRTIRPSEAKIVREVARRLLAGESLHAVAADLNNRGVGTVSGKRWTPQSLRSMILRPRLAGQRTHNGEVVAKAKWSAIVPPAEHKRVVDLLTDPDRRKNRTARTYLLSGLVRCDRCGTKMVSNRRSETGQRTYACVKALGGCGRMRIVADRTEDEVVERLLGAAETGELAARFTAPAPSDGGDDLAVVTRQLTELAEDWAARLITREEWHAARAPLQRQLDELRAAEAAHVRASTEWVDLDNLDSRWPTMSFDQRRAVAAKVIEAVQVMPSRPGSNRFDPDRIHVEWVS